MKAKILYLSVQVNISEKRKIMNKTMTNDKQTTTEGAAISVQRLVIMAVFVAMTFVVTTYINVRIPFLAAKG